MKRLACMSWLLVVALSGMSAAHGRGEPDVSGAEAGDFAKQGVPSTFSPRAGALLNQAATTTVGAAAIPTGSFTSLWFLQVVRLIQARIDQNVVMAFVNNTPGTFNLGAEQIIYLYNLGVSRELIDAMLDHDQLISSGLLSVSASTVPVSTVASGSALPSGGQSPTGPSIASTVIARLASVLNPHTTGAELDLLAAGHRQTPGESIVVQSDAPEPDWAALLASDNDVPEQPDSLYRVRMPYPVRLTDPIIVFRYPGD